MWAPMHGAMGVAFCTTILLAGLQTKNEFRNKTKEKKEKKQIGGEFRAQGTSTRPQADNHSLYFSHVESDQGPS